MAKYKAYPEYKDSGVEWLGEIPTYWQTLRGKYVFKEVRELSTTGDETLLSVSEYYGVKPRQDTIEDGDFISRADSLIGYKKCQVNDLAMNIMLAWKTGLGVSNYDGIISPAYSVFRFDTAKAQPEYMHYLLRTKIYTTQFKSLSTGVIDSRLRLYPETFGIVEILLPSLGEQKKICAFLSHETAKIDNLIEKQQQLIELLKEKRQAVISHAVTKGLNPDVPMKDSGVEWLGEVPAHWVIKPLRYLGDCQNGINIGAEAFGSGFPFVSYGDAYKNRVLPDNGSGLVQSTAEDRRKYSLLRGDVLFTRTSEKIEEIGFASACIKSIENACFAGFLIRFRPKSSDLCIEYSKYYFSNQLLRVFFTKEMNLITRASLSQDLLKTMPVAIPPVDEQMKIAHSLDKISDKFDQLQLLGEEQIKYLQERRTALISAAVTGKIDVRDWVAPDTQDTEEPEEATV